MTIPSEIKLGGCYQGLKDARLAIDLTLPVDNTISVHGGVEYDFNRYVSLRTGWRSGPYSITGLGWLSGFTSGFGLRYRGLRFDYAFVPYGKLGLTHRISLSGSLAAIKGGNSLTVAILDGDTKHPLKGRISLTGAIAGIFETDVAGRYIFRSIRSGWCYISTFVDEYPQNYDSVYVYPEGDADKNILLYLIKPGILRGIVYDAVTKQPIRAVVLYQGKAYGKIANDSIVGSFVLNNLPAGDYFLTVSGSDPKYIPQSCSLAVPSGKLVEREFYLVRQRAKIILRGVTFDTGKAELKPESYPTLDEAGKILTDNPDIVVEVGGHTDPREIKTSQYPSNWELSFARAEVVVKYLIDRFKINPARLSARGYADTQPIAPNTTEEGMAQNRRTEFKIAE
jgi:outer membrane protein OmpA-like peptidoglycan-associated protein